LQVNFSELKLMQVTHYVRVSFRMGEKKQSQTGQKCVIPQSNSISQKIRSSEISLKSKIPALSIGMPVG